MATRRRRRPQSLGGNLDPRLQIQARRHLFSVARVAFQHRIRRTRTQLHINTVQIQSDFGNNIW